MDANPPPSLELQATSHSDAAPVRWCAMIAASPEPLMLPRLLQKLICQGGEMGGVNYERRAGGAEVTLRFTLPAGRAYRLAQLWRALMGVREVTLEAAEEAGRGDMRR